MKGFLKGLLIAAAVIGGVFAIGGFLIPQQWTVTRSITITAPAEHVYEQVANLRNWQNWAPWNMEKDPTQVYSYEGPVIGVGAKWLWTGEKMGRGFLEIKKADPKDGMTYELFIDMNDMQSTIHGTMTFKEKEGHTDVTWVDSGDSGSNFMRRWMSLVIGKVLGQDMEDGLKKLKTVVENRSKDEKPVADADGEPAADEDREEDAEDA